MSDDIRHGWKVYTSDRRPPVRGGDPVWSGTLPHTLAPVTLDTGRDECAPGYHYCADLADALRIGCEIDPAYHATARARLGAAYAARQPALFDAAEVDA